MSKYTNAIRMLARENALDADVAGKLMESDGGPGSGNFGHKGRPGKKGGSAPKEGGSAASAVGASNPGSTSKPAPGKTYTHGGKTYTFNPSKYIIQTGKKHDTEWEKVRERFSRGNGETNSPVDIELYTSAVNHGPKASGTGKGRQGSFEIGMGKPNGKVRINGKTYSYKPSDILTTETGKQFAYIKAAGKYVPLDPDRGDDPDVPDLDKKLGPNGMSPEEKADFPKIKKEREERWKEVSGSRKSPKALNSSAKMAEVGTPFEREPVNYQSAITKYVNKARLKRANTETADWAFREKSNYPEGSDEYKAYNLYENVLSKPLPGRPTADESAALIQKSLSNVSPTLKEYAVNRYKKDLENEPQITSDICDIADALGTQMYGLQYRIKEIGDKQKKDPFTEEKMTDPKTGKPIMVCRYQEKIEGDMAEAEAKREPITYEQAVDNISDLVRYTQACTEENLVTNYERTRKMLEKKGYKVAKIKNYYNTDPMMNPYRGLNCVFVSPTGTRFELQFHTPKSLIAKEAQHGLYEKDRTKGVPESLHEELQGRMRKISAKEKVPYPRGIENVKNYP